MENATVQKPLQSITQDALTTLVKWSSPTCCSLYLPADPGLGVRLETVRLKHLVDEAVVRLVAAGLRRDEALAMMEPARALMDDTDFWIHRPEGLALFLTPDSREIYRLPFRPPELTVVGEQFHLKPLLLAFSDDGRFHIVTVTKQRVQMFRCSRFAVDPDPTDLAPDIPGEPEVEAEKSLQTHGAGAVPAGARGGKQSAIFHGHGKGKDLERIHVLQRFRRAAKELDRRVHADAGPIVLVGTTHLLAWFGEATSNAHILSQHVTSNPGELDPAELHRRAWVIAEPEVAKARHLPPGEFDRLLGARSPSALERFGDVIPAAADARVAVLLVDPNTECWGTWDAQTRQVAWHDRREDGDVDLLDIAALLTARNGGTVCAFTREQTERGLIIGAIVRDGGR